MHNVEYVLMLIAKRLQLEAIKPGGHQADLNRLAADVARLGGKSHHLPVGEDHEFDEEVAHWRYRYDAVLRAPDLDPA